MKKFIVIILLLLSTKVTLADWPLYKRTILIPSYSYFTSSKYFDSTGRKLSLGSGNRFVSNGLNIYLGHGLTRRIDFVMNLPFLSINSDYGGNKETKSGFGDIQAGFSFHFPLHHKTRFITAKASLIIPTYQNNTDLHLGYGSKGFQLGLNYSFVPLKHTFLVTEAYFTRYFDRSTGPNQFGLTVNAGKMFLDYNYLNVIVTTVVSRSSDKSFNTSINAIKDFEFGKVILSYGRRISRRATPYIQGFYTFFGRNAGVGLGGNIIVIFKLP